MANDVEKAVKDSMNYSEKVSPTCGGCKYKFDKPTDGWAIPVCQYNRSVQFKVSVEIGRCDNWTPKE